MKKAAKDAKKEKKLTKAKTLLKITSCTQTI